MTAKEMFKELGFKYNQYKHDNNIWEYNNIGGDETGIMIIFDTKSKHLEIDTFDCGGEEEKIKIRLPLLQAINKQVEELGWGKGGK